MSLEDLGILQVMSLQAINCNECSQWTHGSATPRGLSQPTSSSWPALALQPHCLPEMRVVESEVNSGQQILGRGQSVIIVKGAFKSFSRSSRPEVPQGIDNAYSQSMTNIEANAKRRRKIEAKVQVMLLLFRQHNRGVPPE